MTRPLIDTEEKLKRWLQKTPKPIVWVIRLEPSLDADGKVIEEGDTGTVQGFAWSEFVSVDALPRGQRLLMKPKGAKGGIHVKLPFKEEAPRPHVSLLDPQLSQAHEEIKRRSAELREREDELQRKHRHLLDWETRLLDQGRQWLSENTTTSMKLDTRQRSIVDSLAQMEQLGRERIESERDGLIELDHALKRAQSAEERNEIAAAIAFSIDRILGTISIWGLKRKEDIPPELLKDMQEFAHWKAAKRYTEHLPKTPQRWVNDFLSFEQPMQEEILRAVIAARREMSAQQPAAAPPAQEAPPPPSEPTPPPAKRRQRPRSAKARKMRATARPSRKTTPKKRPTPKRKRKPRHDHSENDE